MPKNQPKVINTWNDCDEKQKTFVLEYLSNGYNATAAYELTHPNAGERKNTWANACRYRKQLQKVIDEKTKERYDELNITAEHIIMQLAEMGFSPKEDDIYTPQIKLKALDLMQKQLGVQTKNVKAEADVSAAVTFVDDLKPDENKSE